ncbi:MAG: hypothetical protein LLG04_02885 [Parachlamydia sp.]|nr:hypothetical protein [Parachlamydia sp.]
MNIYNDCHVPVPLVWRIGRDIAIGIAICGLCGVIAGVAAAILGNAPVVASAVSAALFPVPYLVIGWIISELFRRVFIK